MKITKTKLLASTVTLGLASSTLAFGLSATPAQASKLVTQWSANSQVGWCSWVPPQVDASVPGLLANPGCPQAAAYPNIDGGTIIAQPTLPTEISWGVPFAAPGTRSSLVIDPVGSPLAVTTNNPSFTGPLLDLTHINRPIVDGGGTEPFLSSAVVLSNLSLTALAADDPAWIGEIQDLGTLPIGVSFFETPNLAPPDGAPCPVPVGTVSPCPDVVVIDTISGVPVNNLGNLEFLARTFDKGSYRYDVFAQITGLTELTGAQCLQVVGRATCVGAITEENMENVANLNVRIQATELPRPVPEPSSLAGLLAVGMAGLGWLGKRKKAE